MTRPKHPVLAVEHSQLITCADDRVWQNKRMAEMLVADEVVVRVLGTRGVN